jgi:hypothetical protein
MINSFCVRSANHIIFLLPEQKVYTLAETMITYYLAENNIEPAMMYQGRYVLIIPGLMEDNNTVQVVY